MITAIDIVKYLNGLSIERATAILQQAQRLLTKSQLVSAESPSLREFESNLAALEKSDGKSEEIPE
jgi:hypothetical protein